MPGYSEACVSGHHETCADRDCRCLCPTHTWNRKPVAPPPATQALSCPICVRIPRPGDQFCRGDGERLVSPQKCEACGQIGDRSDRFCGKCGRSFAKVVPAVELTEEEIAAIEARARSRPSDVEVPPTEIH